MHSWSIFGAWIHYGQTWMHKIHHGQTWTHKTRHSLDLEEATTFPLITFSVPTPKCYFVSRLPSWKSQNSRIWRPITFCANLRLKWSLKKNCRLHRDLSKGMWHATYTQVNQGDYQLLVVNNQIGSLIPNLFFYHNLCFKYFKWVM